MPQMAPMHWTSLLLYFTIFMIIYKIMNFYMILHDSSNQEEIKITPFSLKWKW